MEVSLKLQRQHLDKDYTMKALAHLGLYTQSAKLKMYPKSSSICFLLVFVPSSPHRHTMLNWMCNTCTHSIEERNGVSEVGTT